MSMVNTGTFEFTYIQNLLDFIRPLIAEGYSVATQTVFCEFPRELSVEKYIVHVSSTKDRNFKISLETKE